MDHLSAAPLRIGDWIVDPRLGQISRGGEIVRLEARTMRLLMCLAQNAGEVVSIDDLLSQVWSGVVVTPDSVYQGVTALRRLLGDDPKRPTYIATVPRLGYRMIATVAAGVESPAAQGSLDAAAGEHEPSARPPERPPARGYPTAMLAIAAVALVCGALVYWLVVRESTVSPASASAVHHPRSVAVLPFLDLTDAMNEEPFADGMTEELINKLSLVPGLKVPAPTSSFYFKGKQLTVKDIAHSLNVAYVLDGSVRKSGTTLRVAARLVRADDNYVVWANTYDRSVDDKLMVQDDIAGEVTKALSASIN
jgi:TolB-like protein/DNA-binding winged helix-turn-helix (wHTH) protein